ncbi:hypothetical protein [Spiroplasma endosymbiont of Virgichneumon dumeticola]|uniref:hypothetical protein n=1 Tax=Spiroplasma endosymbiont of Virgichneumon dumeticola TaxID=3139323 RepID=UPI0035C8A8C7
MTPLNFTIDSEIIRKFLAKETKNEGIRLLIELFLNKLLKINQMIKLVLIIMNEMKQEQIAVTVIISVI